MTSLADVLVLTVNKHETEAVLKAFKASTGQDAVPVSVGDRVYRDLGVVNGTRVFHAISEMGSGGVGGTQQAVDKGIRALSPTAVIAVGIAFGVNENKQEIGDILLSKQLQLYDLQRVGQGGIIFRGDKPHASPRLINIFEGVAQTSWSGAVVRPGMILSGEKLIDDIDYRDQLLKMQNEAVGGEMEGAGLYVSSADHKVDWIVVKSICDWADGKKSRNKASRQRKASQNAADFIVYVLSQVRIKAGEETPLLPLVQPPVLIKIPPLSYIDRVTSLLERLTDCVSKHQLMMSTYLRSILNKGGTPENFESSRLELDQIAVETISQLQMYIPRELRDVILRLRRMMSCSWQPPSDIYYTLYHASGRFPRGAVEAANQMRNELWECYLAMTYLYLNGNVNRSEYVEVLKQHNLQVNAFSIHDSPDHQIARTMILEYEYFSSHARGDALDRYSRAYKEV